MKIKNNIKEIVSATRISEAIKILKNLVSDKEYFNQILLLESRYNKAKIDQIKGLIYIDAFNIEIRNVSNSLLELIDDLPKEFDLLIKSLEILVNEQLISLALDVIEKVLKNNQIVFIGIKFKFNSFQEHSFENENPEATEESLTKFNEKIQEISYELMLHIQNLSEIDLIDDWQSRYWDVLLREQNDINYSINPLFLEKRSRFYNDIINREDQAKGKLLLWQEEFLTQEYEKAKKYCEEIRIENGIGDAQIYEYLLLTYSKDIGANNLIKSFLSSAKSTSFDKLLLYLERAQHLGGQTSTLSDSLMEVYMDLMSSINRYYQNISYDYVSAPAQKGRSQKRNIIKGCIEATVMIYTSFYETLDKSKLHPIVEDMIVEIEGGGKYDWVKMQNDQLTDKTTFDAIKKERHC